MSKIFSNIVSNTIKILLFYFLSIAQLFSLAQSFERFDYLPVSINGNDQANIKVYTGFYQNDTLKFKLQQDGFFYNNGINVYAVDVLKPAIADINKDGDIDIIGFNVWFSALVAHNY